MNKTIKLFCILSLIILSICFMIGNKCFAVIDMNLAATISNVENTGNIIEEANNVNDVNNTSDSTTENDTTNTIENTVANSTSTNGSNSATVSNISALPESGLGLANVLNILLIAIGIVIILLGVAIIIKLKK